MARNVIRTFCLALGVLLAFPSLAWAETIGMSSPAGPGTFTIGTVIGVQGSWSGGQAERWYETRVSYTLTTSTVFGSQGHGQCAASDYSIDWNTTGRSAGEYSVDAELWRSDDNLNWTAIATAGQGSLTLQ